MVVSLDHSFLLRILLGVIGALLGHQRAVIVQNGHFHHIGHQIAVFIGDLGRAELRGNMFAFRAVAHHGVHVAGFLGHRIRCHQHSAGTVAAHICLAGIGDQQTAVSADLHFRHAGGSAVEILAAQILVDRLHHLTPQAGCRVAAHFDLRIGLIAAPDGCAIVGGKAHEVTVAVGIGRTGLTGGILTGEIGHRTGTATDNFLEHFAHQISGGFLHGSVGFAVILHQQRAVVEFHTLKSAGLGVNAVVDKGGVCSSHFLRGHTVLQAAQRHVAGLLGVGRGQGLEAQLFDHEIIGCRRTVQCVQIHSGAVRGELHRLQHAAQALILRVGVLGPHIIVGQMDGIVIQRGSSGNGAVIQRGSIGGNGLDGRTALAHFGGPVPAAVIFLGAGAAHHGQNIAGIGIHQGDRSLQRLTFLIGVVGKAGIFKDLLSLLLIDRVLAGVNLQTLAVDHGHCLFMGSTDIAVGIGQVVFNAVVFYQSGRHVADDSVGIVGVSGGGHHFILVLMVRGDHLIAQAGPAVGKHHFFGHSFIVLALADLALLQHVVQHMHLALAVFLAAPVGTQGVIHGGVIGDADEAGALSQRQFGSVLTKVFVGRRLHTVALVAQIDGVEIDGQDLVLGVAFLLQRQRTVDLRHLTLDTVLTVAGDVLDELLGDGGTALHVRTGNRIDNAAQRTLPVHACVLFKALVLDGNGSLLQIIGDILALDPDTVLVGKQRLIHHPLAGGRIFIIQLRGHLLGVLGQIHFHVALEACVHIEHENAHKHGHRQNAYQTQRAECRSNTPSDGLLAAGLACLLLFCLIAGALLRFFLQSVKLVLEVIFHHRAPSFLPIFFQRALSARHYFCTPIPV